MLADGPSAQDDDRYAASMLAQLLGEAGNSKLHWALVETGLAEAAQAAYDGSDHAGLFYVFAMADPEKLGDIEKIVDETIVGALDDVREHDLERLRNKAALGVTLAGEKPSGRMQRLGRLLTTTGEYRSLENELERIRSVTLEDIRGVSERWPFEKRTVGRLVPKG
jgi:predicted Zn-dependent peptidase